VLARAFRDNPLNRSVIGERAARRLRANRAGMRAGLQAAFGPGDVRVVRAEGRLAGVLVALPPLAYPLRPPPWPVQLRTLWVQGLRVAGRWRGVFEALDRHHPDEPHWHLALLGVEPALQGRGLGRALLADWLATVDAQPAPAWLETDRAANVPFYEAAGFAVQHELRVRGVPVWLMARRPDPAL
jgi:GNAT superfamily N-acetyltransferase